MPDNPWGGHTYTNSLEASPATKKAARTSKRIASQPTGTRSRRLANGDDDSDNSDSGEGNTSIDPIDFLSSSQAGSPPKQRTKTTAPSKNHTSRSYHTDLEVDIAPAPVKEKKAKKPGNPFSKGLTNKATSKKTEPVGPAARHRTAATNAHDRLDAVDVNDKPQPAAVKKNDKLFKNAKKAVAKQDSDDEFFEATPAKRSPRSRKTSQPRLAPFPLDLPKPLEPAPFPMALPSSSKVSSAAGGKASAQQRLRPEKKRESFGLGPDPSPVRPKLLATKLEAFPMAIPDKPQTARFPMSLPSGSKSSPKRSAEDESPQSDRSSKRRKALTDDDLKSSPGTPRLCKPRDHDIDSTKLCPFCDEAIPDPSTLSSVYHSLLRAASARSVPVRRRNNPKGLKAPFSVYISVCERHRFESKLLPQAVRMGWPTNIDFDAVPKRLMKRKKDLEAILRKPKENSSFFREAMDEVAKVGIRVAESAMGQYATFERIQPGYYGERGSVLIHQTLFNMFPPEDMSDFQSSFAPLSTHNFTHAVLLPEAALLLILEDQPAGTSREAALKTMRASSRFGSQMYPDDDDDEGDDDNGRSVGEALMRERAAKRRKEIEEEDRLEEEALRRENERRRQRGEKEIDMDLAWTIGAGMLATSSPGTGARMSSTSDKARSKKPVHGKDVSEVEGSDASVKSSSNKPAKGTTKATTSSRASREIDVDVDIEMEDIAPAKPALSSKRRAKPTASASASANPSDAEMSAESSSRPPTRQSTRTTTKQQDLIRVDTDSESSLSTASKTKRKGKAKEKVTDLTISDSESAAPKRTTIKTSVVKSKPGPASVIAARKAKAVKAPAPPIHVESSEDEEEVENVLDETPKPNRKQALRSKSSSSSSSDASDGDDEDDIDSETMRRLQHRPTSIVRPTFSSQPTPPSSSLVKAVDVRSPSPSENRPLSASSNSRAQAGRAGGGKKTVSINSKSVSSSQESSQSLSIGGFSTPRKRSKTNSQSQTDISDANMAIDQKTPRGVLAQRSNGAIPQQQPYRAKPSDKWLLGNSSPEKDVGSQDAQQQPITHEDFDDFFNAEPGSDDYA